VSDQPDFEKNPADSPVILVAEDEVLVRVEVSDHLRDCGFNVLEVSSADEARALFTTGVQIDAVFSDINMPGPRDGIELALWVELNYPHVPVLLTSGLDLALKAAAVACKSLHGMVSKPYQSAEIARVVREMTARR
jgi:CheY-like chemotaxis protein